jgi:hypothetical protein
MNLNEVAYIRYEFKNMHYVNYLEKLLRSVFYNFLLGSIFESNVIYDTFFGFIKWYVVISVLSYYSKFW